MDSPHVIWRTTSLSVAALVLLLTASAVSAEDYLRWNAQSHTIDAHLTDWKLARVVQELARQSRWEVYAEAGLTQRVTTEFEDQPEFRALELLLGKLNFAVLPGGNGPRRLYIFETSKSAAVKQVVPARPADEEPSVAIRAALERLRPENLTNSHRIDREAFGTNAVPELMAGLTHPDPEVRQAAASALGYFEEQAEPAINSLIQGLNDTDLKVRLNSTMALGQLGQSPDEVLPALIRTLENPEAPAVMQAWTTSALGEFESLPPPYREQIRPLLEQGLEHPSRMVQVHSREALNRMDFQPSPHAP